MSLIAPARLPAWTACTSWLSAGPAAKSSPDSRKITTHVVTNCRRMTSLPRALDLGEHLHSVITDFIDRNSGPVHQGQEQIGERRLVRVLQMLIAFELSVPAA